MLIDKQIPGPNKTEPAQLVRYRYALYGTGTLSTQGKACIQYDTDVSPLYENKNLFIWQVKDECFRPTQLFQVHLSNVTLSLLNKYFTNSILNYMSCIDILQSSLFDCFMPQEAVTDSATTSLTW